jgi:cytochrome P450
VLKESMRIYPPVPMLSRQAIADITIGGHDIRAGTSIVMPIYAIHRHHKRWRDPDVFDPTRFAPENEAGISRYQYLPFGAGPRICIGASFSMTESVVMLASFVRAARFATPAGRRFTPVSGISLRAHPDIELTVSIRNG